MPQTYPNLQTLTREWQNRLRLQDWDLMVEYVSFQKMDNACGCAQTRPNHKIASILIAKGIPESDVVTDIEVTLVHELIHVKMDEWFDHPEATIKNPMFETFVEQMAQALVAAKRGQVRIR